VDLPILKKCMETFTKDSYQICAGVMEGKLTNELLTSSLYLKTLFIPDCRFVSLIRRKGCVSRRFGYSNSPPLIF